MPCTGRSTSGASLAGFAPVKAVVGQRRPQVVAQILDLRNKEMVMRTMKFLLVVLTVVIISGCATTGDGATWKCTAHGLVNSYYTGSDSAMIHLQGFSSGGSYKVTKNAQGTEATGTTANGTPFTCVKTK